MLRILGVHSNVIGDANSTAGHAWLTMHFGNGRHVSVGLWTSSLDDLHRFIKDPTGLFDPDTYDINIGLEDRRGYVARASRYYGLTPAQGIAATRMMMAISTWRYFHTCASWARDVVGRVTGEELRSAGFGGLTDTPSALGAAIVKLEAKQPTSLNHPKPVHGNPVVSALLGSRGASALA